MKTLDINGSLFTKDNPPTVNELRKLGCSVKVHHIRMIETLFEPKNGIYRIKKVPCSLSVIKSQGYQNKIIAKGGETEVEIRLPNSQIRKGKSEYSRKDAYNKKEGVKVAIIKSLFT